MDAAKGRPDTVFFALFPPHAQAAQAASIGEGLLRRHDLPGRASARERLHVTLAVAGQEDDVALPDIDALRRAAATVAFAPFDVSFDHARSFPPGDGAYLVLGCDAASTHALRALHDTLAGAMRAHGVPPRREGPLQPHLTLAKRIGRGLPAEPVAPVAWRAETFALVRSVRAVRYLVQGEWALGSA